MKLIIKLIGLSLVVFYLASCSQKLPPTTVSSKTYEDFGPYSKTDTFRYVIEATPSNLSKIAPNKLSKAMKSFLDTLNTEYYLFDPIFNRELAEELTHFYRFRKYDLAWSSPDGPLERSKILLTKMMMAHEEGLEPEDYSVYKLLNLQERVYSDKKNVNMLQVLQLDVRITASYITYAWHMNNGRINPRNLGGYWFKEPQMTEIAQYLSNLELEEAFAEITPKAPAYSGLKTALARYRAIAYNGGWPVIDAEKLEPGDRGEAVVALKQRLAITGDLAMSHSDILDNDTFDYSVEEALRKFQARHGLDVDGVAGKKTLIALNVPVEDRIAQIKINMERLRWMPDALGDHYIVVNVPEYMLRIYKDDVESFNSRVVVGKTINQTPIFHDELEYLVFSPTWTVPKSIINKEMLPAIKKNPGYLTARGYKLYTNWNKKAKAVNPYSVDWSRMQSAGGNYRIVQAPGPTNALGLVKFIMPNSYNIYLHDTPSDHLFARSERAFSHGCIRVEKPKELASYLLEDKTKWDDVKIEESMHQDKPKSVRLKRHVPVYIVYRTSWTDSQGTLHFRKDIYNFDEVQTSQVVEQVNLTAQRTQSVNYEFTTKSRIGQ